MKKCKYEGCGQEFEWAYDDQAKRWVALVPLEKTEGLTRTYVDADGKLRALHREVCTQTSARLTVTKLDRPIPGAIADNHEEEIMKPRKRRRSTKKTESDQQAMSV